MELGYSGIAQKGKGTAKERSEHREVRRTFKMLREVWLNIGVKKLNMHKDITVKVLLDSGTTGMFINKKIVTKHRFKLQNLERPVVVRNIDRTNNSAKAITYQVEVNIYYKNHIERMRMDICNLGKTNVILGMLWLQPHNPEINWKTGEVKMTRCLPLYDRTEQRGRLKEEEAILEEKKIMRYAIDNKEG